MARRGILPLVALTAVCALSGCTAAAPSGPTATPSSSTTSTITTTPAPTRDTSAPLPTGDAAITLPPAGATPDYQLGGAYPPPPGVGIVARDRTTSPAEGVYSICYVNGFQTQPGEKELWPDDLLLRNADGALVRDPDWPDEVLVDTTDAAAVAAVVGPWIEGCAEHGFDAVEFDNLDTYTRAGGALTRDDNVAVATALVTVAHRSGLAAGQKNAAEDSVTLRDSAGFDFAVVEECAAYDECDAYTHVYGDAVVAIEYPDNLPRPFREVCADPSTPRSVVLRDRELVTPADPAYVFETCG
jgi:hypothetical protein